MLINAACVAALVGLAQPDNRDILKEAAKHAGQCAPQVAHIQGLT